MAKDYLREERGRTSMASSTDGLESAAVSASRKTGLLILVSRADLALFSGVVPKDVAVLAIRSAEGKKLSLVSIDGTEVVLTAAPMLCLGLLATSEDSLRILENARRTLISWSDTDMPEPCLITDWQHTGPLSALMATSLVDRLHAYAGHVTRLSRELFRLRAAHEDMLNAFADVENFVAASSLQPCNLTFESLPVDGEMLSPAIYDGITQTLPVSTFGLSIIQIHVQDWALTDRRTGGVSIDFHSLEDHQIHQTWHIPLDDLEPGWVTLALSGGLAGPQRTPVLTVRSFGGFGELPPLSLGAIQPLAEYRPRRLQTSGKDDEVAQRSLALRT